MEFIDWNDSFDRFILKNTYGDFSIEFVFFVDHKKGEFKLESARKRVNLAYFDLSKMTMEKVYSNIENEALEKYINYLTLKNQNIVPRETILQRREDII